MACSCSVRVCFGSEDKTDTKPHCKVHYKPQLPLSLYLPCNQGNHSVVKITMYSTPWGLVIFNIDVDV